MRSDGEANGGVCGRITRRACRKIVPLVHKQWVFSVAYKRRRLVHCGEDVSSHLLYPFRSSSTQLSCPLTDVSPVPILAQMGSGEF